MMQMQQIGVQAPLPNGQGLPTSVNPETHGAAFASNDYFIAQQIVL